MFIFYLLICVKDCFFNKLIKIRIFKYFESKKMEDFIVGDFVILVLDDIGFLLFLSKKGRRKKKKKLVIGIK